MLKKRLIFVLLYDQGKFMLSRNFKLQSVGNIDWLRDNYDYDSIAYAIDELVILNVSKEDKNIQGFCEELKEIAKKYFMPIAVGGGIVSLEDAKRLFNSGADKIILNTSYFKNPKLIADLIKLYGRQSIVAAIDYDRNEEGCPVYIHSGKEKYNMNVLEAVNYVEDIGAGEILLTSMYDDGTGEDYDYDTLKEVVKQSSIPIIANGGCGQPSQFVKVFKDCGVSAAATADLFNFMCDGLQDAREYVRGNQIELATWDTEFFNIIGK